MLSVSARLRVNDSCSFAMNLLRGGCESVASWGMLSEEPAAATDLREILAMTSPTTPLYREHTGQGYSKH